MLNPLDDITDLEQMILTWYASFYSGIGTIERSNIKSHLNVLILLLPRMKSYTGTARVEYCSFIIKLRGKIVEYDPRDQNCVVEELFAAFYVWTVVGECIFSLSFSLSLSLSLSEANSLITTHLSIGFLSV